jgi:hypothetical protein
MAEEGGYMADECYYISRVSAHADGGPCYRVCAR